MKEKTFSFNSVKDSLPPNKEWVICEVVDSVTGMIILRSSYFERGNNG